MAGDVSPVAMFVASRYVKNERLVPFGIGKRYCMGELLARNEVFLFTSDLLQRIKLLPPTSNPIPDPNEFLCNFTRIANCQDKSVI